MLSTHWAKFKLCHLNPHLSARRGATAKAEAVTRVVAWQLSKEMKRQGMSKARLAKLMNVLFSIQ